MGALTVYASAARTATPTAAKLAVARARALFVVVDVTAGTTLSIVPTIDGWDELSQKWFNLLTGASITGVVAARVLRVGPGLVAAANLTANDYLPETVRVVMTHSNANSATYSVSAHQLR